MSNSFKLRVLKALTAALKEISPDADAAYVNTLGDVDRGDGTTEAHVFRGRAWFGDDDALPLVSILEAVSPGEDVGEPPRDATTSEYDWPLVIQGFVRDDPEHPTDPAYALLADVRRRLAQEKGRRVAGKPGLPDVLGFGAGKNRISGMAIGSGVVRPADDVSSVAYFWMTLTLRVVDHAADPFL